MGIEVVNPFELPLLNTVNCANILSNIVFIDDYIAALVKIQLYKQNLILYYFYFEDWRAKHAKTR